MKLSVLILCLMLLSGCTTGRLEYVTPDGVTKVACEVEYTWEPSVDRYAVEYILSYCAKQAVKNGNTVVREDLLNNDLTVIDPPVGQRWSLQLAKSQHRKGELTDKQ